MFTQAQAMAFLGQYWPLILVVLVAVVYFVFNPQQAKTKLYGLMLQVEKQAIAMAMEDGPAKMNFVVHSVYLLLPKYMQVFLPEDKLRAIAQGFYDEAKTHLAKAMDAQPPDTWKPPADPTPDASNTNQPPVGSATVPDGQQLPGVTQG